jgi:ribose/xylose/arabinose/galactoside ABC-type transport system permease subunit
MRKQLYESTTLFIVLAVVIAVLNAYSYVANTSNLFDLFSTLSVSTFLAAIGVLGIISKEESEAK